MGVWRRGRRHGCRQAADAVLNRRRRRKKYGLCSFIYHGRADLRGGPDPAGPDEASGASVPLIGFGNTLWQGVKEAVDQNGFIGVFMGGFKASAVGISAALIFGYLASFIFDPKMKK